MNKFIIVIFFLSWYSVVLQAQNLQYVRTIDLTESPAAFSVDPMGAIYVVSDNGSLLKFDTTGTPSAISGRKGKSSNWQIDASNPYKIVVFNRDMQIADIYSSQFSKINSIDFTLLETDDIALLCSSYDNSFWTVSSSNGDLVRLSEQLTITSKTNTSLLFSEKAFTPSFIEESDSKVLLAQRGGPAFIFDLFGNLSLRFDEAAESYSIEGDVLYYLRNDSIHAWHTKLHESAILETKVTGIQNFVVCAPWLAVLLENQIILYRKK